jgi:hypothetical protein
VFRRTRAALAGLAGRATAATERLRLRTHLWRAERRLRARGDDGERGAALDRLRAYRRAGAYPRHDAFDRTPLFRDDRGTPCAVGHLAAADGRTDVVDRVAAADNRVDLTADDPPPALAAWLADAPLSRAEAALVQPAYGGGGLVVDRCSVLTCAELRFLVVSWALITGFLLEGAVYLFAERAGLSPLRRAAALVGTGAAGTAALAAAALVVLANV